MVVEDVWEELGCETEGGPFSSGPTRRGIDTTCSLLKPELRLRERRTGKCYSREDDLVSSIGGHGREGWLELALPPPFDASSWTD